jgi:hypothetical protein
MHAGRAAGQAAVEVDSTMPTTAVPKHWPKVRMMARMPDAAPLRSRVTFDSISRLFGLWNRPKPIPHTRLRQAMSQAWAWAGTGQAFVDRQVGEQCHTYFPAPLRLSPRSVDYTDPGGIDLNLLVAPVPALVPPGTKLWTSHNFVLQFAALAW